jgi:Ca2+-binding RTX toxin-like protein
VAVGLGAGGGGLVIQGAPDAHYVIHWRDGTQDDVTADSNGTTTPPPNDMFHSYVNDGTYDIRVSDDDPSTPDVFVRAAVFENSTSDETIRGSAGNDLLLGGDGNDTIRTGDGINPGSDFGLASIADGGRGNDNVTGGGSNDLLEGNDGNDVLHGMGGVDQLDGGAGNDRMYGGDGNDQLTGDHFDPGTFVGDGNDILDGGAGNDIIHGDGGDDRLYGGADNDFLDGGTGNNKLWGGTGSDTFHFTAPASLSTTPPPNPEVDRIMDFSGSLDPAAEHDQIDLTTYNAISNGPLHFNDADPHHFDRTAGSIRSVFDARGDTLVQADLDGNGKFDKGIDFEVVLKGHHDLQAADFLLS